MRDALALRRYLHRHIEPGLPRWTGAPARWRQVVVIPAYREAETLLQSLSRLPEGAGRTLVILVLNRPDSDPDEAANSALRSAVCTRPVIDCGAGVDIAPLNSHTDLYLHDLEALRGPLPASRGVGLARKTGCDIALAGMAAGAIAGPWICCTDADAELPAGYFDQLQQAPEGATAAVFPFRHVPGDDPTITGATVLYELRLHHYLLGLEYAGSPFAFHTLGSCLAVRAGAYAHVRGFPRRSGGEDFHLLNKLAKLGGVARLRGECIRLRSRASRRVPFGTGPAVAAIAADPSPGDLPLFYHPRIFTALGAVLGALPALQPPDAALEPVLTEGGLPRDLAQVAAAALHGLGLDAALHHCRRQGRTQAQFKRHFHQWFDALRTLRFCHALRDAGWPLQSLAQLGDCTPRLWPAGGRCDTDPADLRARIAAHWGWTDGTDAAPCEFRSTPGQAR